jgi:hypothetical protein
MGLLGVEYGIEKPTNRLLSLTGQGKGRRKNAECRMRVASP